MRFFGTWPQLLRRLMQLTSLFALIWVALGGAWRNYKVAYNNARLVGLAEGDAWATAYATNEKFLGLFGDSFQSSLGFLGIHWSASAFGLTSVDPTLALSNILATGSMASGILLAALPPLLLALVAGRFFCSHICPARLMFEIGEFARRALKRWGVPLADLRFDARLSPYILAGGLAASAFGGSVLWLFILPYVAIGGSIFLLITTQTASVLLVSVVVWLVVDVLVAPGLFCTNLCPTGFLLGALGRKRIFALRTVPNPEPCPSSCRACERICPYGISSRDGQIDHSCDSCGRCVSACPMNRLQRRLGRSVRAGAALSVMLTVLALPGTAFAHHNKGLPHYGYFENYPQVPIDEYVAIDGRWEIGAVIFNFQGYDSRETSDTPDDVKLYIYLYDLELDQNYVDDVDFLIRDEDGVVVAEYLRLKVDEEAVYSTRERLPRSGDYEIVARLKTTPPQEVVLPFHVDLREGPNYALIIGIGAPVLLLFGLAVAGRSRRRRR